MKHGEETCESCGDFQDTTLKTLGEITLSFLSSVTYDHVLITCDRGMEEKFSITQEVIYNSYKE